MTPPSCSLYAIIARDRRSVIVFRRGPTRRAALLHWWLDGDRIAARCLGAPSADLLAEAKLVSDRRSLRFRELAPSPKAKRW